MLIPTTALFRTQQIDDLQEIKVCGTSVTIIRENEILRGGTKSLKAFLNPPPKVNPLSHNYEDHNF